ncbi:shikimate dehydrogenase [Pelotomaculum propionicicum]|uniref:shikimate dehydrogenase n=1 Tax=Pelotomaculum propionicicum TaxID=258475 RepID=UPI003B7D378A
MAGGINGRTKICGIFGRPVEHTFSPALHNAAFAAAGLDYAYVPFEVSPGSLAAAVEAIRALGLAGVNVTIPHKEAVLPLLDGLSDEAELTGAVNTIINRSGYLYGDNTDGKGYLRALKEAGFDPADRTVLFLGAGGAARAVAVQLALAGAGKLVFANRTAARASGLSRFVAEKTGVRVELVSWPDGADDKLPEQTLAEADLVVQATSLGMSPNVNETVPLPFEVFRPGQVASDLVYNPVETLFLKKAGQAGATAVSGLGMLLHQGALAFELWTGVPAPLEVMREALVKELSNR